jgi:SAM-dependent methyltransferase
MVDGSRSPSAAHPLVAYEAALELASAGGGRPQRPLGWTDGERAEAPLGRWLSPPPSGELALLAALEGPVLDVGCGPGRHTAALIARGVAALGVDVSAGAARLARRRGATVMEGSIFDPVPGEGMWGGAFLLDGNIGIGGDPLALLRRVRALLRRGGRILVELDPAAQGIRRTSVRLEHAGRCSRSFPWARVGIDALGTLGSGAGLRPASVLEFEGRAFAFLTRPALPDGVEQ